MGTQMTPEERAMINDLAQVFVEEMSGYFDAFENGTLGNGHELNLNKSDGLQKAIANCLFLVANAFAQEFSRLERHHNLMRRLAILRELSINPEFLKKTIPFFELYKKNQRASKN